MIDAGAVISDWNLTHCFNAPQYEKWSQFSKYFIAHERDHGFVKVLSAPDECFNGIAKLFTACDVLVYIGCGNARNVSPFTVGNFKTIICCDLAPVDVATVKNSCKDLCVLYARCSAEDIVELLDRVFYKDLSSVAIITQCTLMYITHEQQELICKEILARGCKNIVFHEFSKAEFVSKRNKREYNNGGTCCSLDLAAYGFGDFKCIDARFIDYDDPVPRVMGLFNGNPITVADVSSNALTK